MTLDGMLDRNKAGGSAAPQLVIGLNAVIVAVTDEEPRVLVLPQSPQATGIGSQAYDALPFGPLDPESDRTLELALRRWVRDQTGLGLGYVEQLYTFGDRHRDEEEPGSGARSISIGYLTLAREGASAMDREVAWRAWYDYFPWEDWRAGRPSILERKVEPALAHWMENTGDARSRRLRQDRIDIAFGLSGAAWDGDRVLDRYELLYEAGLVAEAMRDAVSPADFGQPGAAAPMRLGRAMHSDHRRILATGMGRLRGKIRYRPVVFELLPETFTLLHLQKVVEALSGVRLHKQNFRRLVEKGGLVEGTGQLEAATGGRPAELFCFRREVWRERPAPGVGLPGLPGT